MAKKIYAGTGHRKSSIARVRMTEGTGKITVNGKLTSFLELGAGFHPDFSGRENIYFNASIFGLTKKEIDNRLQTIGWRCLHERSLREKSAGTLWVAHKSQVYSD